MDGTKKLCRILDELGVEHETYVLPNGECGVSWIDGNNIEWEAVQLGENFEIHALQLVTPEQAVTATVGARDYTYDEWRAINEAVGDAMEYAHEHAVMYPDKADPLWNIDEYVNRVLEVAYGTKDATVGARDTMELWPEWEQVLFANVSDEVAQDNLNECVHELLDKAAMLGAGTCIYTPDETGFTWWDENDVEHYEEHSASDECCSASCDKCGNQMMVGDDGWFNGWDEITEWWEEDGSYHKGYVLEPRFKYCPNCGRRCVG